MSKRTREIDQLSFSQKLSRLRVRLRDAEWRRYGMLLLVGKALGIAAVFAMITVGTPMIRAVWEWVSTTVVHAQEAASERIANARAGSRRSVQNHDGRRHHQPDQHRLGSARRVPGVRHAGGLHHARGRLLSKS